MEEEDEQEDVIPFEEEMEDEEFLDIVIPQEENIKRKLISILEVVPDCDPTHIKSLIKEMKSVTRIVEHLLTNDDYPKINIKKSPGKGKKRAASGELDDQKEGEKLWKLTTDWWNVSKREKGNLKYRELALDSLNTEFDTIHKNIIKKVFYSTEGFYAPTYSLLRLLSSKTEEERGWSFLKKARTSNESSKGKTSSSNQILAELEKEILDSEKKCDFDEEQSNLNKIEEQLDLEASEANLMLECGTCYGESRFETMLQCNDAHLYCKDCTLASANAQISLGRCVLPCLEGDCEAVFDYRQVEKILPPSAMANLQKLRSQNEIDSAGLDKLEKCPFCEFACCIENDNERLFNCLNEQCGIVSCRKCRRLEHLPKSCEEMERDSTIHSVADAMSMALIRKCPNKTCLQPYLKESGCNYMTCSKCHSGSCYVCQKLCKKDAAHFDMVYPRHGVEVVVASSSSKVSKCPLFDTDNSLDRDQKNVEEAKSVASERVLAYASQTNSESLKLEIERLDVDTKAPPPPDPYAIYGGFDAYHRQNQERMEKEMEEREERWERLRLERVKEKAEREREAAALKREEEEEEEKVMAKPIQRKRRRV